MILEIEQVKELIKEPKNGELLKQAVKIYDKLQMHVNGIGVTNYLDKLEGFEDVQQKQLRDKLARSNKGTFSALLRPIDKIFTAKGGSISYNLPDKTEQFFKDRLSDITGGVSLHKWIEQTWVNKFITDPNGIIMFEVKDNEAYPTYKAIPSIYDYHTDGIKLDYLIFKPTKSENEDTEYYRVIDDNYDAVYQKTGDEITLVEDRTFKNHFGFVPAILCSDIPCQTSDLKISPIDEATDIADEYLRESSIHTIYKFLHGYPIFWAYIEDCKLCGGTGKINGVKCTRCDGYGKDLKKDVSKIFGMEIPTADEQKLTPDIAGYVAPDIATWKEQRLELEWLNKLLHFTVWGTHTREQSGNETATGRFIDTQPVHDRLTKFSATAENIERQLINMIGAFYFRHYDGCSIAYGRRFQIETPDQIFDKLLKAKEKGASENTKRYYTIQYYQSEFSNDLMSQTKYIKLLDVEPFPFYTTLEVKEMEIPRIDYMRKVFYIEWLSTLTNEDIILKPEDKLRVELTDYTKLKIKEDGKSTE